MQPPLTRLMSLFTLSFCLASSLALADDYHGKPNVEPDFSAIPEFKPLIDRTNETPEPDPTGFKDTSFTGAQTPQWSDTPPGHQKPFVLSGRIESLENAIKIEQGEVDWYDWYLSARTYLSSFGGLDCLPGTPVKFYRNGIMEVQTPDMLCQNSIAGKCFPLPQMTHLDAVILPVRRGVLPPANRDELYNHIKKSER